MRTAISQFSNARNYTRMSIAMAAIAIMLAPSAAGAQGAGISGIVTDTTGGVLPGVTVEVRDAAGGVQTAFTDGTGMYSVTLQPGTYNVTITLPGFNVVTREVTVAAGAMVTVDAELGIAFAETVAVVGTRTEPRSITASPVPIDVIRAQDFVSQGDVDLTNQLRTVVPSFNVNTQPISDAATIVRPANLRNMAPDHTLILVNGKRRHRAAVIAWLGNGIADGAQGPDLSSIPSIALRQVEVLRDGAAAQYGSDAIAGVINFELKNARSGGSVEFRTGQFYDGNDGDPSTCGPLGRSCNAIGGRAQGFTFAGNAGLPLGPQRLNLRGSRPAVIAVALRGVGDTQMQRGHAPVRVPAHEVFREPARAGRPRLLPRRHALRDLRRDGRDKRGVVVLQGPLGGAAPTVYATRPSAPAFPTGRLQRPAGWEWAPVAAW